jgi:hypothetical protein
MKTLRGCSLGVVDVGQLRGLSLIHTYTYMVGRFWSCSRSGMYLNDSMGVLLLLGNKKARRAGWKGGLEE